LEAAGHEIACVYSQPPRPAGRGRNERKSPVHAWADRRGLAVRTPRTLTQAAEQQYFAALGADVAVVAAYGLILPKPVLDAPRWGCINIHASLLPRWRGAAPIQRAILAGDDKTGVTIMQMDEGLDTGAILLAAEHPITPATTAATLHNALGALGARLIVEALDKLAKGELLAVAQPAKGVTYAPKLSREEGRLDWRKDASLLERQVRAFDPWPGAWFELDGERIKVLGAVIAEDGAGAPPGAVLDARLTIACGSGALRLTRLQKAGRAVLDAESFLRGRPVAAGARLA
ncbi:MAG TPA: methionyl-tRNA formyltransferase, partial [Alphaproteobacteria bacterium]|nr:methionyl-tRNA formyltransferase [Alphaproteobacteria bacterium]